MNSAQAFQAASAWLSTCPAAAGEPNDVKLELYGLFKFATTGAGPTGGRPGMFSMAARAKYDAWVAQAGKQADVQDARARYVEIATRIGWKGEGLNDVDGDVDLDNLSEDDEKERERVKALSATGAVKGKGKDGAAGAMGGRVSVMAQENHGGSSGSHPIHDAALENNVEALKSLVHRPGVNMDERDEYGFTPLHLAADRGHLEAVKALLAAGADRSLLVDDDTAEGLAKAAGHDDVAKVLATGRSGQ